MRISEVNELQSKIKQVKAFAHWAIKELKIQGKPEIEYGTDLGRVHKQRSFGSTNSAGKIWTHVANRNAADAMRTLCHELVHFKQFEDGTAFDGMDDEHLMKVEDEANAIAGRMMRAYGKQNEHIYEGATGNAKLKKQLLKNKKTDYDSIDQMMTDIADECDITPKQLHDNWVEQYKKTPDAWIKQQLKGK
jgi:hypothetical protein